MSDEKTGPEKPRRKYPDLLRESELTYDDYASFDDGNRYELVEGKLELMSAPTSVHQLISFQLQHTIYDSCQSHIVIINSPIDVILSQHEVRQPDLVIIRRDRLHIISKRGIEGPPDVVVEILSPSTLKRDKRDKLRTYAKYGIPEYWVVDPEGGSLEQYMLDADGQRYELRDIYQGEDEVASPNLPCAQFTMQEIMDNIPQIG